MLVEKQRYGFKNKLNKQKVKADKLRDEIKNLEMLTKMKTIELQNTLALIKQLEQENE